MIEFNPYDFEGMCKLMDKYGDSNDLYVGENEIGEDIEISIFTDHIVVSTYQSNGWIRKNTYWRNGTTEETYKQ